MATYFDIMQDANDPNVSNSELAVKYNPDAIFSEANGGAAARSCGHSMKVRAEKMIAEGRGDEQYVPIRQRGTNGNGGTATAKPKCKVIMASAIESMPLRTLAVQAVTVATMTYQGDLALDTTQASICAHLEAQTPCLINALTVMAPLMGLDPDDAIVRLAQWSGVKTEEERCAERCRKAANSILDRATVARNNQVKREQLELHGFVVTAPDCHSLALQVDKTEIDQLVTDGLENALIDILSAIS